MPDRGRGVVPSPPLHPTAVFASQHHLLTFLVLLATGENSDRGDSAVGKCVGEADNGVGCCFGGGEYETSETLVAPFFHGIGGFHSALWQCQLVLWWRLNGATLGGR